MRKETEVKACPRCGSTDVSGLRHLAAWLARSGPTMGVYTCQECGYEGLPILFESKREYSF